MLCRAVEADVLRKRIGDPESCLPSDVRWNLDIQIFFVHYLFDCFSTDFLCPCLIYSTSRSKYSTAYFRVLHRERCSLEKCTILPGSGGGESECTNGAEIQLSEMVAVITARLIFSFNNIYIYTCIICMHIYASS